MIFSNSKLEKKTTMTSNFKPLKIFSTLAVRNVLKSITSDIERVTGRTIEFDYGATVQLCERIRAGARGDIVFAVANSIDELASEGILRPNSRIDLVSSDVGMAVQKGAKAPDISTLEALTATLLATPSIVMSKQGASGLYFAGLIKRLGIEKEVLAKATVLAEGLTGEPVARGEAVLAVQQMSELMQVSGIDIFAKLPPAAQQSTIFSLGIFNDSSEDQAISKMVALMRSPAVIDVIRSQGLDPL
jgi:molybdate transport system substrate-binding protein